MPRNCSAQIEVAQSYRFSPRSQTVKPEPINLLALIKCLQYALELATDLISTPMSNQVGTYLSGLQFESLSLRLMWLNNCSIGFSHGEYCAFKRTLALKPRAVQQIDGCLCMEALSIKTTMCLFLVSLSTRSFYKTLCKKLSKTTASVPPSVI